MNQVLTPADGNTRLGKDQWIVLAAAFLGWMFDGLEMGLFPIAARPALRDLMSTVSETSQTVLPLEGNVADYYGWLVAMFLLGAAAGGWVFGWLGDRLGRVKMMALSIGVYAGFTGLCAFATEPWHLAGCRFLSALGMGGEWALGVALVMESWPEKYRPILAGAIGAAANFGFLLISILGSVVAVTIEQWRWIMVAGAVPALLALFVVFFVPESKKWKASLAAKEKLRPLREVFSSLIAERTILGILLASVALIGTWGAVSAFIPPWVDQMIGGSNPKAKSVTQIMIAIGAILGCFIGPALARWLNRRLSYFLLCLMSFIACQYLFHTFSEYGNAFLLTVGVAGLLTASFYGWLPLYLSELFPTRVRATGQGIAFNTGRVFAAAGALTSGHLIKNVFDGHYPMACATITCVYLLGMMLIALAPETKGQPLPD